MRRIRRATIALIALGLPIALTSCGEVGAGQRHGQITLSIGHSPSEVATQTVIRECARTAIEYAAKEGAVLDIAPVAATSYIQWRKVDFHLHGPIQETNYQVAKKVDDQRTAAALRVVNGILAGPIPPDSSDQINSLAQAGRVLAHAAGPRLAVICADGHTVSPELNIYRQPLDSAGARRAIESVRWELTSMRGVDVAWGDAGGDRVWRAGGRHEAQIAHFWTTDWARAVDAHSVSYQESVELPLAH